MIFTDKLIGHDPNHTYFNSRGHRCKDIENINLHNYILFVGDNVAVDLGTPIEKTYPHLISAELGCDYYNLSIFNGGVDCLLYNLLTWLSTIDNKPKAIILSSEFLNSFLISSENFYHWEACDTSNDIIKNIFHLGNHNGFFEAKNLLAGNLINIGCNIQIYQIVFKDRQPININNAVIIEQFDNMFNHKLTASLVVNKIKSHRKLAKP